MEKRQRRQQSSDKKWEICTKHRVHARTCCYRQISVRSLFVFVYYMNTQREATIFITSRVLRDYVHAFRLCEIWRSGIYYRFNWIRPMRMPRCCSTFCPRPNHGINFYAMVTNPVEFASHCSFVCSTNYVCYTMCCIVLTVAVSFVSRIYGIWKGKNVHTAVLTWLQIKSSTAQTNLSARHFLLRT